MSELNVNLGPCTCRFPDASGKHRDGCRGVPIPIPCPWPASITVEVTLGECTCGHMAYVTRGYISYRHDDTCPGKPVKISCSITSSDGTWAGTEVTDAWPEKNDGYLCSTGETFPTLERACRKRWAQARAVLLGSPAGIEDGVRIPLEMCRQRDAMFANIAEVARAEQVAFEAQERGIKTMGPPTFLPDNFHRAERHQRASASMLHHFTLRLFEQMGIHV